MRILLFILIFGVMAYMLTSGKGAGNSYWGIMIILALLWLVLWMLIALGKGVGRLLGAAKSEPVSTDNPRPATERQLNYIDALIEERVTEPWMLEADPETLQEASALIDALLEQPRRER